MIRIVASFVFMLSVPGLVLGANILSLEERDLEGDLHNVGVKPGIVDINSTITVNIDKINLREGIASKYDEFPIDQLLVISDIQDYVKEGMEALPDIQKALGNYLEGGSPTPLESKAYFDSMRKAAKPAVKILRLGQQEPRLRTLINERHRALPAYTERWERQRATFQAAAVYVEEIERELDQTLTSRGVYVQMGAWLLNRGSDTSIHLPGFDEYPLGEFDEVERWDLTAILSKQNKQQFENVAQTAKQINEGNQSVIDALSSQLPDAASVAFESVETCIGQLEQPVNNLQNSLGATTQSARQQFDETKTLVLGYKTFITSLKAKYGDFDELDISEPAGLFQQIVADAVSLRERTALLKDSVKDLHAILTAQLANLADNAQNSVTDLDAKFDACQTIVNEQIVALQTVIGIMENGREIVTASLEYTDKVLKHDLDALPETSRFDLRYSGIRNPGDAVVLRISTGRPNEVVRHVDERHLRLYKVLTYVDVAVSLIFADPDDDFGLNSRFHAAPSYSVLLKTGSRDSTFRNELQQYGYGLNFAALDFNSDEAMELGVGLAVTAYRDFLQFGYGYNLNADSGYWFLGLKFPLPGQGSGVAATPR